MTERIVEGLDELEKALLQLEAETAYKAMRVAGRKAMKPVLDAAKEGAQKDTGDLVDALSMKTKRGKEGDHALEVAIAPFRKRAKGRYLKRAFIKALAQEHGTKYHQPSPFLRPALENNVDKVLGIFKKQLATAIEKVGRK